MVSKQEIKTKQQYRIHAKKIRANLNISLISQEISKQITNLEVYKNAGTICSFYPFSDETDLRHLYNDFSKKWYLPKILDEANMEFYSYETEINMEENRFGIPEPVSGIEMGLKEPDIIIVPALMVDKKGHRLGYGRGYYDRFLAKLSSNCVKITTIPEELITRELPVDEFDVHIDIAVTQAGIYRFNY